MAQFLALHTIDPRGFTSEAQPGIIKACAEAFTPETYCVASWVSGPAGKIACLWEAPSEQAVVDVIAKIALVPVDGVYPTMAIDWAEMKKQMAGG